MNSLNTPALTDGVILLRPQTAKDAAGHLAGEDEEMARWVSGGKSTRATVETFIRNNQEGWRIGGVPADVSRADEVAARREASAQRAAGT